MFGFLKIFSSNSDEKKKIQEKKQHSKEQQQRQDISRLTFQAGAEAASNAKNEAMAKFRHPDEYTGHRALYDSGTAKRAAKQELFRAGKNVKDPYTGNKLFLTKQEAKATYGENWTEHLAESDHVTPLEQLFSEHKDRSFLTNDDLKETFNSPENLQVTSRKYNNAKRSRTNEEFVTDEAYLKEKGVKLKKGGKEAAIEDSQQAEAAINKELRYRQVKNALQTGHDVGLEAAQVTGITALGVSGVHNLIAVAKGEKSASEAIADTANTAGTAAVTGYVTSGGLVILGGALSKPSSPLVRDLMKSNVPMQVTNCVMTFGGTIAAYGKGEITTAECMTRLSGDGMKLALATEFSLVGQTIIPVPVLGAAIGMAVGNILIDQCYDGILGQIHERTLNHERRMAAIAELEKAAEEARTYRSQLEEYLANYFHEYRVCFDSVLTTMHLAFEQGDAEGVIAGANQITTKLGGEVKYRTVDEFRDFFDSEEKDCF